MIHVQLCTAAIFQNIHVPGPPKVLLTTMSPQHQLEIINEHLSDAIVHQLSDHGCIISLPRPPHAVEISDSPPVPRTTHLEVSAVSESAVTLNPASPNPKIDKKQTAQLSISNTLIFSVEPEVPLPETGQLTDGSSSVASNSGETRLVHLKSNFKPPLGGDPPTQPEALVDTSGSCDGNSRSYSVSEQEVVRQNLLNKAAGGKQTIIEGDQPIFCEKITIDVCGDVVSDVMEIVEEDQETEIGAFIESKNEIETQVLDKLLNDVELFCGDVSPQREGLIDTSGWSGGNSRLMDHINVEKSVPAIQIVEPEIEVTEIESELDASPRRVPVNIEVNGMAQDTAIPNVIAEFAKSPNHFRPDVEVQQLNMDGNIFARLTSVPPQLGLAVQLITPPSPSNYVEVEDGEVDVEQDFATDQGVPVGEVDLSQPLFFGNTAHRIWQGVQHEKVQTLKFSGNIQLGRLTAQMFFNNPNRHKEALDAVYHVLLRKSKAVIQSDPHAVLRTVSEVFNCVINLHVLGDNEFSTVEVLNLTSEMEFGPRRTVIHDRTDKSYYLVVVTDSETPQSLEMAINDAKFDRWQVVLKKDATKIKSLESNQGSTSSLKRRPDSKHTQVDAKNNKKNDTRKVGMDQSFTTSNDKNTESRTKKIKEYAERATDDDTTPPAEKRESVCEVCFKFCGTNVSAHRRKEHPNKASGGNLDYNNDKKHICPVCRLTFADHMLCPYHKAALCPVCKKIVYDVSHDGCSKKFTMPQPSKAKKPTPYVLCEKVWLRC